MTVAGVKFPQFKSIFKDCIVIVSTNSFRPSKRSARNRELAWSEMEQIQNAPFHLIPSCISHISPLIR